MITLQTVGTISWMGGLRCRCTDLHRYYGAFGKPLDCSEFIATSYKLEVGHLPEHRS